MGRVRIGRTFTRNNPMTGAPATKAAAAGIEDANRAAEAAGKAAEAWGLTGPNARRRLLNAAAAELEARADDFVAAMMGEIGATEGWARFNLMLAAGMVREAAALTTQIGGEVIPSDKPGWLAMALREPVGPVLGIAPWNAPIILGVRAIAVPLACGNAVILKASEMCPRTHALIVEAFAAAGFPEGVVNVVTNAPRGCGRGRRRADRPSGGQADQLHRLDRGRPDHRQARGRASQAVLLELGGKAPLIVLDDADLDEAVKAAAFGAFMNQGQICMSTERIIVVDAVADAFVEKFRAKATSMACGDPREGKTPLGAVVDEKTVDARQRTDRRRARQGRGRAAGGKADGVLMPATVIDQVTSEMKLYRDESFGPVVAIIRARDEADAIRLANDSEYGLSAAVFTRDTARGLRVARQIRSGICHVNGPTVPTRRRCRSAASAPPAMAASAARPASTASPNCAGSRSRPRPAITRFRENGRVPCREHRTEGHRRLPRRERHRLGEIQSPGQAQLHEPNAQSADDARCSTSWNFATTSACWCSRAKAPPGRRAWI